MSSILNLYQLLELPLSFLVKNNPIPHHPIEELKLDTTQPSSHLALYLQTDLVICRKNCLSVGLLIHLRKNQINSTKLPRFLFFG